MANPPNSSGGSDPAADAAAKQNNALWYAFQGSGRAYLIKRGTPAALDADAASLHGYSTIEQAQANANSVNKLSQTATSIWDGYASLPVGGGAAGVIETVNITAPSGKTPAKYSTPQNPVTAAAKQVLGNITGGITGFSGTNFFLRALKVIVGGVLVIVGFMRMTGAENAITKAVSKIPPIIPV